MYCDVFVNMSKSTKIKALFCELVQQSIFCLCNLPNTMVLTDKNNPIYCYLSEKVPILMRICKKILEKQQLIYYNSV